MTKLYFREHSILLECNKNSWQMQLKLNANDWVHCAHVHANCGSTCFSEHMKLHTVEFIIITLWPKYMYNFTVRTDVVCHSINSWMMRILFEFPFMAILTMATSYFSPHFGKIEIRSRKQKCHFYCYRITLLPNNI